MSNRTTVGEVLACDACRAPIDDIERAMVFWWVKENEFDQLTGKRRRCSGHADDLSAELWWFASHRAALHKLASMAHDYAFSVTQLERLVEIAWAIPHVGGNHAAKADEFATWEV
jgi:hypothetical protein